jgi:hypothetical protein
VSTNLDAETLLRDLEVLLLDPRVRSTPHEVAALLDDAFVEIGQSGRRYDKASIVEALQGDGTDGGGAARREMLDYEVKTLAPGLCLTTYRVVVRGAGRESESLRSSIWRQRDGLWKIVFHQGTPLA